MRLAWLLLFAFAFVQLVVPAYACATTAAAHPPTAVAQVTDGDAPCTQHVWDSPLCFKHCHPDPHSTPTVAAAMAVLAPGPAGAIALLEATAARVQPRSNAPGLPPPPSISFCRQLL